MSAKKKRLWCSERFEAMFAAQGEPDVPEVTRRRRVIDFFLLPGRVQAKIQDDGGKLHRVDVLVRQLTDPEWEIVFAELARQAFFLASFLSGQLPEEIEDVLGKKGVGLVPSSPDELDIICDNVRITDPRGHAAGLVLQRLCERLDEDPFSLFLVRGKGREESLLEISRHRELVARPAREPIEVSGFETPGEGELEIDSQSYWRSNPKMRELSYNLRADELPASILKRLDPMPLMGLEEDIELILEDAYAQVARRAQVYGLELKER